MIIPYSLICLRIGISWRFVFYCDYNNNGIKLKFFFFFFFFYFFIRLFHAGIHVFFFLTILLGGIWRHRSTDASGKVRHYGNDGNCPCFGAQTDKQIASIDEYDERLCKKEIQDFRKLCTSRFGNDFFKFSL